MVYEARGQLLRQSVESLNCQTREVGISKEGMKAIKLYALRYFGEVSSGPGSRRSRALTLSS